MGRLRQHFPQHPRLLADKFAAQGSNSSDIASWPIEAGDKTLLNRIGPNGENDRDRTGYRFGCLDRRDAVEGYDLADVTANQIGGESRQAIRIVGPLVLDLQILAFDVAGIFEPLAKPREVPG